MHVSPQQLKVLNDDFRKIKHWNWTKVTQPGWNALVADCEIQFCMAVRDPNNNATNGITRTSTTKTSFGTNNLPSTLHKAAMMYGTVINISISGFATSVAEFWICSVPRRICSY